jgi:hypothetical protein
VQNSLGLWHPSTRMDFPNYSCYSRRPYTAKPFDAASRNRRADLSRTCEISALVSERIGIVEDVANRHAGLLKTMGR